MVFFDPLASISSTSWPTLCGFMLAARLVQAGGAGGGGSRTRRQAGDALSALSGRSASSFGALTQNLQMR